MRLDPEAVKQRFGWTEAQLAAAKLCGLGPGEQVVVDRVGSGRGPYFSRYWLSDQVEAWVERVRSLKLS